ncbi:hypothetical protein [Streptomyces iranensis]|uniref:hypothetical protein n=1 Tax=Streptomyces iranensis TaxID=576784 RepID=UPI0039B75C76
MFAEAVVIPAAAWGWDALDHAGGNELFDRAGDGTGADLQLLAEFGGRAISTLVLLALLAIRDGAELTSVTPGELLAQCVNLTLLAVVFGALALALGAAFGRRAVVLAGTAVIGVLAYTAHTFAAQLGVDWLANLSPFHHYIGGQPLRNGFQWAHAGALAATAVALVALGAFRFGRRDIGV